jgi:hypothetical protein
MMGTEFDLLLGSYCDDVQNYEKIHNRDDETGELISCPHATGDLYNVVLGDFLILSARLSLPSTAHNSIQPNYCMLF